MFEKALWDADPDAYVAWHEGMYSNDPFVHRFAGYSTHPAPNGTLFNVPAITKLSGFDGLYLGGAGDWSLSLPDEIDAVLSLYQGNVWLNNVDIDVQISADDDVEQDTNVFIAAIDILDTLQSQKLNTLVHCHMGLNRSATVIAGYLVKHLGYEPDEAIQYLRTERSPAVLCNPTFEAFVRSLPLWPAGRPVNLNLWMN